MRLGALVSSPCCLRSAASATAASRLPNHELRCLFGLGALLDPRARWCPTLALRAQHLDTTKQHERPHVMTKREKSKVKARLAKDWLHPCIIRARVPRDPTRSSQPELRHPSLSRTRSTGHYLQGTRNYYSVGSELSPTFPSQAYPCVPSESSRRPSLTRSASRSRSATRDPELRMSSILS